METQLKISHEVGVFKRGCGLPDDRLLQRNISITEHTIPFGIRKNDQTLRNASLD